MTQGHDEHGHNSHHDSHDVHGHDSHDHLDQGHDEHGHDEHGHDSHDEHSDSHAHDEHEHGDEHHSSHDEHGGHGDDHFEEEIDETGTIVPIGTINDILQYTGQPRRLDIASLFPFSETLAVDHNPGTVVSDIHGSSLQIVDLSFTPIIRIKRLTNPLFKDIFHSSEFMPIAAWKLFVAKYIRRKKYLEYPRIPRFEKIQLQEPVVPEFNSVDVRASGESTPSKNSTARHFDLYKVPLPFGIYLQRLIVRERRLITYSVLGIIISVGIVISAIAGSLFATKLYLESGVATLRGIRPTMDSSVAHNAILRSSRDFELARLFGKSAYVVQFFGYKEDEMAAVIHVTEGFAAVGELIRIGDTVRNTFITDQYPDYSGDYLSSKLFVHQSAKYTDFARKIAPEFLRAHELIQYAEYRFSSLNSNLFDADTQKGIQFAIQGLKQVDQFATYVEKHATAIGVILGDEKPMKYLILNQNRDEIRANGGFPGSAIEVELYKGRIVTETKRDIYYYDWHLYPYAETPPLGISELTNAFGIRDANYDPIFKDSFQSINRLFEKSGGGTLDGVFGIHQGTVEKVLGITGPIQLEGIAEPFTQENFSRNMSLLVETEFGRKNSPKDVLFTFVDALLKSIHDQGLYKEIFEVVASEIENGQVVGYVRDARTELFIENLLDSKSFVHSENFMYPVFTSISGNKSDRYMERTIELTQVPQNIVSTGGVINTIQATDSTQCDTYNRLLITSFHNFTTAEEQTIRSQLSALGVPSDKQKAELIIQGNATNKQYVRLILPKGSKLLFSNSKKVHILTSHPLYDVFGFYVDTGVRETSRSEMHILPPPMYCGKKPDIFVQPGLNRYTITDR